MRAVHGKDGSANARGRLVGAGLVLLSAVGFSVKAVLAKLIYRHGVDALTVLAFRMLFSLPFYLVVGFVTSRTAEPLRRGELARVLGLGLVGYYLASYLDFRGLEHVTAGLERLVLFLYPTIVVVLSYFVHGRKLGKRDGFSLALSYGGIALVFAGDVGSLGQGDVALGGGLVFGSAVAYACYLVGSGPLVLRLGPLRFTAFAMTVSSVASVGHFLLSNRGRLPPLADEAILLLVAMALFATVLPTFLQAEGLRRVGPSDAAMIGAIGPVVTIFLGAVFLDEPVHVEELFGTVLVLGGVLLVSIPPKPKAPRELARTERSGT